MNIYFYNLTYDEIAKYTGDEWLKNADPKAHFYFKDTMPADVEVSGGGGGSIGPLRLI